MNFGDRLKQLRTDNDMSREELAKKLNISYSAVSKYETNVRFPDQDMLKDISIIFNTTTDYLLGNSNIINPYKEDKEEYKEEINFLESFRSAMMERGFDYFKDKTHEELADIAVKFIKANDIINNNDNKSN